MGDSVKDAFQRGPQEPRHRGGAEAGGSLVGGVGLVCTTAVRLRAYCFATGRPISEVAADIVARRLSLRNQRDSSGGQGG
ncbi:hypothetical protein [Nocardia asteroides]|uniref:hypothetical protein n=1 Tax=Nocardia asteroides TaxID=1824 RepID=UPI001E560E67|nr:hypothetical protein [Nocardia asteroides]UGT55859.1 hypothetical protein LTT85_02945 [Nocardia asteroides]